MSREFYEKATARFIARQCRQLSEKYGQEKAVKHLNQSLEKEEGFCRGSASRIRAYMKEQKESNE